MSDGEIENGGRRGDAGLLDGASLEKAQTRGKQPGGAFEGDALEGSKSDGSAFERSASDPATGSAASNDNGVPRSREAGIEAFWRAYGIADASSASQSAPSLVIVDADPRVRATLLRHLGQSCAAHDVAPAGAVALLRRLASVDIALVDCDPPPSQQAPIFRALARWPGTVCVLMSHDQQKVEQLRALGLFAPLVLDKPLQPTALAAIRAAVLEIAAAGV